MEWSFSGYIWSAHLVVWCELPVRETWLLSLDCAKEGYAEESVGSCMAVCKSFNLQPNFCDPV